MAISQIPVKFIFHSYSESSTFGSTRSWQIYPPIIYWFHRWLFMGSQAAPADHLTLWPQINPAIKHLFHRWLCMGYHTAPADHITLHLQISPLNGNSTDSCSDSSYFIPTLRAHHLADQVLTVLPTIKWWFHRFLWNSYFIPPLSAYHLADQVLADLPPFNNNCAHICQTKCWQI